MYKNHNNNKLKFNQAFVYIISAFILLAVFDNVAFAHKVMIFAWVEGDTIYTQSKFSGGKKVNGGKIVVLDLSKKKLLEGVTDEKGEFSFKIPKTTDLKIVLDASMGHKAEWNVPSEEILAAMATHAESKIENSVSQSSNSEIKFVPKKPAIKATNLEKREIQKMINNSLDIKLAPIANMLITLSNPKPKMTEIIGGVGYIVGIVGVALYCLNRRKKQ